MRLFLTGGGGFIGSHICEALLSEENQLIILDHFHRNALKYLEKPEGDKLVIFKGDVTDYELLKHIVRSYRPEAIINLAAMAGIETVERKPLSCIETNFFGPYYLSKLAIENDVDRLIHFSSSEVYGEVSDGSAEDSVTPIGPAKDARWSYASSKATGDHLISSFEKQYGLNGVVIRPFNIFGERQTGHGAISHFIVWALQGKNIRIYGDGSQVRAWCYVKNLVDATIKLIDAPETGIFNIGDPRSPETIMVLAEQIIELTGSTSETVCVPKRSVDVDYRVPNVDKAKNELGWVPTYDFEEGLKRTIDWYRSIDLGRETWRAAIS